MPTSLCLWPLSLPPTPAGLPRFAEQLHDLPYGDKVLHFTLFGLLALVANLALASRGKRSMAHAIVMGSIFVAFVATAEECSNWFLTNRDWSLGDLIRQLLRAWFASACCRSGGPQLCSHSANADENDSSDPHDTAMR